MYIHRTKSVQKNFIFVNLGLLTMHTVDISLLIHRNIFKFVVFYEIFLKKRKKTSLREAFFELIHGMWRLFVRETSCKERRKLIEEGMRPYFSHPIVENKRL